MEMSMVILLTTTFSISFSAIFHYQLHSSWLVFSIGKCGFDFAFGALAMSLIAEHCVEHFSPAVI